MPTPVSPACLLVTPYSARVARGGLPLVCAALLACLVACGGKALPDPPRACTDDGTGCLPDEQCVDGACIPLSRCDDDTDCPSAAYQCVFPAQFCDLRPGFAEECSLTTPCDAGFFCALGRCRALADARPCARRTDCPQGQACDRNNFLCIEEASCTLADSFPETACDPDEQCSTSTGRCTLGCLGQCTPETEATDCGAGLHCDGSCRCVQCLSNDDCGPGLECNVRAGRCQSENLCFSDDDCEAPLICDPRTALCQVAPPSCEDDFDCTIAETCNLATGRCESPQGACIDDRFEDADTPQTAEEIALDVGASRLLDDLQLCPDDDDVYALPLLAGESFTAIVSGSDAFARATVWLLDERGETSLAFSETPPRGNGTIRYTAQRDETVYLRLNALLGATRYDLNVDKGAGAVCAADFFEGASGNDTPATATAPALLPTGVELVGEVCPGDEDWLRFSVQAGEGLAAALRFDDASADLDLAFFDGATNERIEQSAGVRMPELLAHRFLVDTDVLVRVRGFGNSFGAWHLVVDRLAPTSCVDTFEPDDTAPTSLTLSNPGDPVVQERALCGGGISGDVDGWNVALEDFERLVVVARAHDPDLQVQLDVLDENGALVKRSPIGSSAVTYDARGNEIVTVRARGLASTTGDYTLSISKENQGSCAPDAREPDDTFATAASLPDVGETLVLCGSDEDWFRIDASAGKRIVVDLSFLQADGDLDVMLVGLDGRQLLAISDGRSDGEHLSFLAPVDGTYGLRVFSLSPSVQARYALDARLESP